MHMTRLLVWAVLFATYAPSLQGQGLTAFNFNGRLNAGTAPASGLYDFNFRLFDAPTGGSQVAGTFTTNGIPVVDGLFSMALDFGPGAFDGTGRWLDIAVKSNGMAGAPIVLSPRQPLKPAPMALYALTPAGPAGPTGPAGPQGSQGVPGPAGPQGIQGIAGPSGPTGATGAVGATGPVGPEGLNWRGAWSGTVNYAVDDAVSHNGSAWMAKLAHQNSAPAEGSASWDLLARRGDAGPAGVQGPIGATGVTGPPGPTGATGPQGTKGDTGAVGPQGPPGATGPAGSSGAFSVSGTSAVYSGGNVGIGTADPQGRLDIRSGTDSYLRMGSTYGDLHFNGGTDGVFGLINEGGASGRTEFHGNNGLIMSILNSGNVGVGTATPGAPLHVSSSVTGSSVLAALLQPNQSDGTFSQLYLGRGPVGNGCGTFTYTHDAASPARSSLSLGLYESSYTLNIHGSGNVGIGRVNPFYKLEVGGNTLIQGILAVNIPPLSDGSTLRLRMGPNHSRVVTMFKREEDTVGGPEVFSIHRSDPVYQAYFYCDLTVYGRAFKSQGGTSWEVASDRRLKQDVKAFEPGLTEIIKLRPVRFRYRDGIKKGLTSAQEEVGVIAQEVREVIPDAVSEGTDGYLSLKADPIHWAAVNAIKALNAKLEEQRLENAQLKKRLEKLEHLVRHQ